MYVHVGGRSQLPTAMWGAHLGNKCSCLQPALPAPADGGLPVPAALAEYYSLYSREQGEGSLDRLLKLHSVMASSLQVSAGSARPHPPRGATAGSRGDSVGPVAVRCSDSRHFPWFCSRVEARLWP